jgi:glycosyltransferase involved in cell wall biosynthesis
MPANPPISAYIRTKNEERMIGDVIRAAFQVADEVLLIDSGSTDRTIEIAEAEGARVIRESWHGWGKQKRIGEDAAKHNWLFDIDGDEIVTPELAAEIKALFADGEPEAPIYELRLVTAPPVGKPWANFYLMDRRKLYDKRVLRMPDHAMDDQIKPPPGVKVGQLRGRLLHYSFTGLEQLQEKFNRHSSAAANAGKLRPLWYLALRLVLAKPIYFLNHYIKRGLWRAGWYGFAISNIAAHGRWLKDAKMMEIHLRRRQEQAPPR